MLLDPTEFGLASSSASSGDFKSSGNGRACQGQGLGLYVQYTCTHVSDHFEQTQSGAKTLPQICLSTWPLLPAGFFSS